MAQLSRLPHDEPSDSSDSVPKTDPGSRMAASLQRLADCNSCAEIIDPVVWQREIRRDRPLPGREE
jgi:hypothetical protein